MQQPLLPSCTFPSGKHVSSYAPSSPSVASDTVGSPPRRYMSLDSPKSTRTKRSATAGDELDAHLSSPMVISTPPETPQDIKHHSHFHLPKTKSLKRIFTLHRIPSKKSIKESLRRSNSSASMKGSPVSPGGATPPPIPDPHASPNRKKPQM
ncbi:hypothetical protein BC940DRAFT_307538 [Gongronella butleri]|nr:hypothetical protein BC940DRAFT_307538 [Gongronella butleri]